MASWMVHLRVADALLSRLRVDPTPFVVGNMAPDSGVPNEDWSAFTPNTDISHFKKKDAAGNSVVHVPLYVQKYFSEERRSQYDAPTFAFHLGYLTHLLTDILWVKNVVEPTAKRDAQAYAADANKALWTWKKDWYDLDFLYLKRNPAFHAFCLYEQAIGFQNVYMDEFSTDAFDNRRAYITSWYRAGREGLEREYPYLTETAMAAFVSESTDEIYQLLCEEFSIY